MLNRWNGLRFLDHRDFHGVPQSASDARHWVLKVLSAHITASAEVMETVELLVSEVVTNSILHSDSGHPDEVITVGVGLGEGLVHIEVIDKGSAVNVPAMRPADSDNLGGRGLAWVDLLSSAWGTDYDPEIGRAVWVQLTYR
ncbi:ATP-binding protein [Microtetraspora sp. AC03309]|uniref:ATP-binding protein n=1 Tax=Microtetraspora sp. AC03309 TaxID=2779376 RepID=UPI001E57D3B1|nr:ATP-binding protein [Microtetraspora sp. AC03309]MCC5581168.1 ATP-binding protein [Microtetraspora sp. AC03309]